MNKNILPSFDPDAPALPGSLFGLPFTVDTAKIVALPIPWDVTVSYKSGASKGPEAILDASCQVDLFDEKIVDAWKTGIAMDEFPAQWAKKNKKLRKKAAEYRESNNKQIQNEINKACNELRNWVKNRSLHFLEKKKIVGLLGGDHSTPLGLMQAVAENLANSHKLMADSQFGILHIDAHCDLRNSYEGFTYSHASIMFNALKIKNMKRLVQVGIRDFSEGEKKVIENSYGRIKLFTDKFLKERMYNGITWHQNVQQIITELPPNVYISFDIDGLDPKLCPNTGTPVPGGLEFQQAIYLIEQLVESGRKIVSFDINEVAPGKDEWDANVGARLLYKISNLAAMSNTSKL